MQTLTHRVQYYETDRMGVTHHSNYIRFMEEARVAYLEQLGFPYAELERRGVISPVTAVNCKYLATTTFDDRITVRHVAVGLELEGLNRDTVRIASGVESANREDA